MCSIDLFKIILKLIIFFEISIKRIKPLNLVIEIYITELIVY